MDGESDGTARARELEWRITNHPPLDELVAVAFQYGLLEDWRYFQGCIHLNVGIMAVTLTAEDARTFLQDLIRRHYLAHCRRGGA